MTDLFVYGYSSFKNGELFFNGKLVLEADSKNLEIDTNEFYQKLGINYPKFFKMDPVSKVGFLCTEILIQHLPFIKEVDSEKVSVLVNTASGSYDSDIKFQDTIQNEDTYFPSPGLFVYTLPNIVIGEICIRNGFKGENLCLISQKPDIMQMFINISSWLNHPYTEICLLGWFEVKQNQANVVLLAVGKEKSKSIGVFTRETINLYLAARKSEKE